jgi:hypothetical protein
MPYYLYRIKPYFAPKKLAEFDSFKQAGSHAKALRTAPDLAAGSSVKIIFAQDEEQALELLSQVRERAPAGDD